MNLDLTASTRSDPAAREQLVAAGFVAAHVKQWIAEDGNGIEAEIIEFATPEGAATYQTQVHRYACGYADEAFEAPMGGIGLRVRYEYGAPYVEQISWIAGNRRYKVQVSEWSRPPDHSRILGILDVVTNTWPNVSLDPPAPTPAPGPELGVNADDVDDVHDAVAATLAENTIWISKRVAFAGSSEIPDGATAYAGGQASLEDTRKMQGLTQFADTEAGLEDSSMEVFVDGTLVYLRGRQLVGLVGEGHSLLIDLTSDDPRVEPLRGMASGHNDASMALFYLYGTTRVVSLFEDIVHEQPARKYTVEIDLDAALRALPEEHVAGFNHHLAAIRVAGIEPEADAEVWVGADGLVHHIEFVQDLGPQLGGGSMATSVDFFDFGVPLTLDIPEPEFVTPLEEVDESQCAPQGLTVQFAVVDALGLSLAPHLAAASTCWL